MLDKEFLEKQKDALIEKKNSIQDQLGGFAKADKDLEHDYDTKFPEYGRDEEENATETQVYGDTLPVEYSLELTLREVKQALKRIKTGKYGICEKCGKEVSKERLLAIPETRVCMDCQKAK